MRHLRNQAPDDRTPEQKAEDMEAETETRKRHFLESGMAILNQYVVGTEITCMVGRDNTATVKFKGNYIHESIFAELPPIVRINAPRRGLCFR